MEEAKGGLEERVARIEGILGQMNERLNPLESRFTQLFYAVITSWVTIIAAVLVAIFKG
jgi:hypothetical protein